MGVPVVEFDTAPWREARNERLNAWLLGNTEAVQVVQALGHIAEVWDDLVDQDRPVSGDAVTQAFLDALVTIPCNGFWRRHGERLLPLIICAINGWLDANELEDDKTPRLRELAFHLRNQLWEVASYCAYLVGGWAHLREVSPQMRRFFVHEGYNEWEHRHGIR